MVYHGEAKRFLESASVEVGDTVRIKKPDVTYEGMVLDRADDADDRHIVLKLSSGYNIGVEISDASIELLERGSAPKIELPPLEVTENPELPDISIISTGGTVASIIDYLREHVTAGYNTGTKKPAACTVDVHVNPPVEALGGHCNGDSPAMGLLKDGYQAVGAVAEAGALHHDPPCSRLQGTIQLSRAVCQGSSL